MTRNWKTVRVVLAVFAIMVLGAVSVAYSQSADDDVFAVVKVTNPEDVVAQIGMLVDKVEPGMGAMVNGMAMGQLQMLLKNPQWAGMDKTGEFTVVVMNPMKYPSPVALVLPMTDANAYVDILKQAMTGGEEVDGAMKFGQEGTQQMFFASAGNLGVLADNAAMTTSVKALIDAESPALQAASVAQGQLTASVAMTKIMASVRPMIEGFSQMMIMGMTQNMAEGEEGAQPPTAAIAGALQAELNALLGLLDQTQKVELGISLDPEQGVRLMKAAFPVADSALAGFFAAQTPKKSEMLGYLPGDAAVVASGSMNFTPEFIDWYAAFTKNLGSIAGSEDPAAAEKMVQFTKEGMAAFGGDFVVSAFSQSEGTLVTEIFTMKDPQKAKELVEQYPETFNSFLGMYKSMGLDLNLQVSGKEAYKGGEILNIDLGLTADEIPDPEGQQAFKDILGDQLAVPMGFVGNYAVLGIGKNARSDVEALMDAVDAGSAGMGGTSPAQFNLPEANNFFMALSVPKVLKWVAKYAPEAPPDFDILDSPGLGMSASFAGEHAAGELVVPLAEILAIKDVVQKIQMAESMDQ